MRSKRTQTSILGLVFMVVVVTVGVLLYVRAAEPEASKEPAVVEPAREEAAEGSMSTEVERLAEVVIGETGREAVAGPALAEYVLLDADDQPVVGAAYRLCVFGEVLSSGETNQAGEFTSDACAEEPAKLLVADANLAPQLIEVPRTPGLHVLHLERRARVSGFVTVDGRRPDEPIRLVLGANRPMLDLELALGLTWSEAQLDRSLGTKLVIVASEQGSFSFRGLPLDWSGDLRVPSSYQLIDRLLAIDPWWRTMGIEQPVEGLRVELTRPLRIVGRVVEVEGGEPVADARIYPTLVFAGGSRSRDMLDDTRAGADGRFVLTLESAQLRGTSIKVCPPDHMVERVIPIAAVDLTGDLDLGDIPLRVDRGKLQLDVLVLDREGAPIRGVVVSILDASKRAGPPTDAEGRTLISGLAEGYTMARALALGFAIEEAQAFIGPEGGELVMTMRADTLLRLHFLAPDGSEMRSVRCAITTDVYPFEQKMDHPIMWSFHELGASIQTAIDRGEGVTLKYAPAGETEDGRPVIISGIKPGLAMRLLYFNYFSTILGERELAPLLPEEHRDVEIVLDRAPRVLRVRVVDEDGQPLVNAHVGVTYQGIDLGRPGIRGLSKSGTENGQFEFEEIFAEHVDLDVGCDGYVPFSDPEFAVPEDGSIGEIQLAPGREVLVFVEDETGRPLEAGIVARLPSGAYVVASGVRTGQYKLTGMPDAEATLTALMGATLDVGRAYVERQLGAHETELRIVLPVAGRVEGQVTLPTNIDSNDKYVVWLVPDDETLGNRAIRIATLAGEPIDFAFEGVFAGSYTARVQWRGVTPSGEDHSEWLVDGVAIEVEPGETTTVELR